MPDLALHLAALLEFAGEDGGAPNHAHERPGRWDSNGRECAECRIWREARAALNQTLAGSPAQQRHTP